MGLFLLVTAALFIGWWLGHPAWGFLVITGLLGLVTAILASRARRLKKGKGITIQPATNGSIGRTATPALPRTSVPQ